MNGAHASKWLVRLAVAVLLTTLVGCGDRGPPRYEVSGLVTYRGEPVPVGRIAFEPDPDRGNRGPATMAFVEDGRYRTERGKGTIGGPHIVKIYGFQAEAQTPTGLKVEMTLFPVYYTSADLPEEDTTADFEVPDQPPDQ